MAVHYELGAAMSGQIFNIGVHSIDGYGVVVAKNYGALANILSMVMGYGVGVVLDAACIYSGSVSRL